MGRKVIVFQRTEISTEVIQTAVNERCSSRGKEVMYALSREQALGLIRRFPDALVITSALLEDQLEGIVDVSVLVEQIRGISPHCIIVVYSVEEPDTAKSPYSDGWIVKGVDLKSHHQVAELICEAGTTLTRETLLAMFPFVQSAQPTQN